MDDENTYYLLKETHEVVMALLKLQEGNDERVAKALSSVDHKLEAMASRLELLEGHAESLRYSVVGVSM